MRFGRALRVKLNAVNRKIQQCDDKDNCFLSITVQEFSAYEFLQILVLHSVLQALQEMLTCRHRAPFQLSVVERGPPVALLGT